MLAQVCSSVYVYHEIPNKKESRKTGCVCVCVCACVPGEIAGESSVAAGLPTAGEDEVVGMEVEEREREDEEREVGEVEAVGVSVSGGTTYIDRSGMLTGGLGYQGSKYVEREIFRQSAHV